MRVVNTGWNLNTNVMKHSIIRAGWIWMVFCGMQVVFSSSPEIPPAGKTILGENETIRFADGLYARNMYELAADEYARFLKDFPDSEQCDYVHFRLGECWFFLRKYSEAESEFRIILEKYNNSKLRHKAALRIGEIYSATGKHAQAIEIFDQICNNKFVPLSGDKADEQVISSCLYNKGESHLKINESEKAEECFLQLVEKYPGSRLCPYAFLKLGFLYERILAEFREVDLLKRQEKALLFYQRAYEKGDTDRTKAEALFLQGNLLFRLGRFDKSFEVYRTLITQYQSDSRVSEVKIPLAWSAYNAGLFSEAEKYIDTFFAGLPESFRPEALYIKANSQRQLFKYADAIITYNKLIEQYPDSRFLSAARYEKALVHHSSGEYEKALAEALKINFQEITRAESTQKVSASFRRDVLWLLADCCAALKKRDEAIQYYRIIIKEFPQDVLSAEAMYRLARNLEDKQEYKEASFYYGRISEHFPTNALSPVGLFASGLCFVKAKNDIEAVRDFTKLIKNYPQHPLVEETLYQKAMSEIRLRKDKDAVESLNDLLRKYPSSKFSPEAHYWIGMLKFEEGKFAESEEEFRNALKLAQSKDQQREFSFRLALTLIKLKKHKESAELLYSLLETPAKEKIQPHLLQWMAEYFYAEQKMEQVITVAKHLLSVTNAPAWQQTAHGIIGLAQLSIGSTNSAVESFKTALQIKANTSYAARSALCLGKIELAQKNYEQAEKYFEQAATMAADDSQIEIRANAYAGLGMNAMAVSNYPVAARYFMGVAILYDNPELTPECLYRASEAFRHAGMEKESKKAIEELKQRYPESKWIKAIQ